MSFGDWSISMMCRLLSHARAVESAQVLYPINHAIAQSPNPMAQSLNDRIRSPNRPITKSRNALLERPIREHDRSPHVRRRAVIVAEALLRLLEVTTDDVDERLDRHLGIRIE